MHPRRPAPHTCTAICTEAYNAPGWLLLGHPPALERPMCIIRAQGEHEYSESPVLVTLKP